MKKKSTHDHEKPFIICCRPWIVSFTSKQVRQGPTFWVYGHLILKKDPLKLYTMIEICECEILKIIKLFRNDIQYLNDRGTE